MLSITRSALSTWDRQPAEKPQRGTRAWLPARLPLAAPDSPPRCGPAAGRARFRRDEGGSWAGWAGRRRGCCTAFTQLLPPARSQSEWSLGQLRRAAGAGAQRSSAQPFGRQSGLS
ncbi:hypothetical protein ACRRTK_007458 [Alexandromys fortis]